MSMKKTPVSEQVLQASIRQRAYVPEGSIDEGVQSAPIPVGDDTRLKKIYVYADNVWYPQSATDYHIVRVKTDAFDLTGWVDFTGARGQDQFQTEIRVTMAHASGVLLQRSAFQGAGNLATLQQMAGMGYISGNHIEILIKQTYSFDNYATKVPVAYQFVVESR
jgi:hypothetical protein